MRWLPDSLTSGPILSCPRSSDSCLVSWASPPWLRDTVWEDISHSSPPPPGPVPVTKAARMSRDFLTKVMYYATPEIVLPNVEAELGRLLRSTPTGKEKVDWRESLLASSSELAELDPSEAFLLTEGKDFLILSKNDRFSSVLSASFIAISSDVWFFIPVKLILTSFISDVSSNQRKTFYTRMTSNWCLAAFTNFQTVSSYLNPEFSPPLRGEICGVRLRQINHNFFYKREVIILLIFCLFGY